MESFEAGKVTVALATPLLNRGDLLHNRAPESRCSRRNAAAAAERYSILQPDQMNAEQKKLLEALLAGPRGGGDASPEVAEKMLRGGPFNA